LPLLVTGRANTVRPSYFRSKKERTFMGILETAKPVVVVCTRDRTRAVEFYRDTLGLVLRHEDAFAAVFEAGASTIHIAGVPDFTPHGHTMLGFLVPDVDMTVKALSRNGVSFLRLPGFPHDELGVLSLPSGKGRVAWLKDPDGNILSITDAE
jgi:catechol 2,3-dioxygenase-like lactoylglutathione lyase family enzyme